MMACTRAYIDKRFNKVVKNPQIVVIIDDGYCTKGFYLFKRLYIIKTATCLKVGPLLAKIFNDAKVAQGRVAEDCGVGVDQVGRIGDLFQTLDPLVWRVGAAKDLASLVQTRTIYRKVNLVTCDTEDKTGKGQCP